MSSLRKVPTSVCCNGNQFSSVFQSNIVLMQSLLKQVLIFSRGATARADVDHHSGPGDGGWTGLQSGIHPPSPCAQWDYRETSGKETIYQ